MNKNIIFKISIATFLIVVVFGIYFTRGYFLKVEKKEITIDTDVSADDILADDNSTDTFDLGNEPDQTERKSDPETKKELVPVETPKETKNNSPAELEIIEKLMAKGFQSFSGRKIDTIIIHSSYDAIGDDPYDLNGLIQEYKSYGVSPHYLIDRDGKIYRLVEDKNIAYHAGESQTPDGRTGVNNFSIGIEIMNTKKSNFTAKQYDSLNQLLDYLRGKYKIKYVLGHNQIAPGRKDDPWNFDWNKIN